MLLISASYVPVLGGIQTVTHKLATDLATRGHEVKVITSRYPRSLPRHEMVDGIAVHRCLFLSPHRYIRSRRPDLFLAGLYYLPKTMWYLHQFTRKFRPDVVNVHFPDEQIPFVRSLRRRHKFRLVVSLHGHDIERWFESPNSGFLVSRADTEVSEFPELCSLRKILRDADGITACSQYLLNCATRLEPEAANKGHVIHNGVDTERFRNTTQYHHDRPYLLAFGRLTHKKGFDLLLEAFAKLAGSESNVDLVLAGEGEEREPLETHAEALGLKGRVRFFGRANPDQVAQLLSGCLFALVPSRSEPFGIVALEILAAGKPLVATNVGGIPEILTSLSPDHRSANSTRPAHASGPRETVPPYALLANPTAEDLATAMRKCLHRVDELTCLSHLGRSDLARFAWSRVVDKYLHVLTGSADPAAERSAPSQYGGLLQAAR